MKTSNKILATYFGVVVSVIVIASAASARKLYSNKPRIETFFNHEFRGREVRILRLVGREVSTPPNTSFFFDKRRRAGLWLNYLPDTLSQRNDTLYLSFGPGGSLYLPNVEAIVTDREHINIPDSTFYYAFGDK